MEFLSISIYHPYLSFQLLLVSLSFDSVLSLLGFFSFRLSFILHLVSRSGLSSFRSYTIVVSFLSRFSLRFIPTVWESFCNESYKVSFFLWRVLLTWIKEFLFPFAPFAFEVSFPFGIELSFLPGLGHKISLFLSLKLCKLPLFYKINKGKQLPRRGPKTDQCTLPQLSDSGHPIKAYSKPLCRSSFHYDLTYTDLSLAATRLIDHSIPVLCLFTLPK